MKNQSRTRYMPRSILIARKWRGRIGEKAEGQFTALFGKSITSGIENSDDLNSCRGNHGG